MSLFADRLQKQTRQSGIPSADRSGCEENLQASVTSTKWSCQKPAGSANGEYSPSAGSAEMTGHLSRSSVLNHSFMHREKLLLALPSLSDDGEGRIFPGIEWGRLHTPMPRDMITPFSPHMVTHRIIENHLNVLL